MDFRKGLEQNPLLIAEGAVIERVRREFPVELDPHIAHAGLIYDHDGRIVIEKIYRQYACIAHDCGLPAILLTPTWRASRERLERSGFGAVNVNGDCFRFLSAIREEYGEFAGNVFIGGLMGCRGDAYRPEEALESVEACTYHRPQAEELAGAGVDFLLASTLPALSEALGMAMAMAMASPGMPYMLSFVVRPNGTLLDGTPLVEAVSVIDSSVDPPPQGYMVNCVHPSVFRSAVTGRENCPLPVRKRIIGLQANTSVKSPEELEGLAELDSEDPALFGAMMADLHRDMGIKILGGCCGTDDRHIRKMVEELAGVKR